VCSLRGTFSIIKHYSD